MNVKNPWVTRIAGLCGVVGPLSAIVLALVALAYSSWFNWEGNTLGDLGLHGASVFFNVGLILVGILNFPFAIGVRRYLGSSGLSSFGTILLVLGGISLIVVGVVTEATPAIRGVVALIYFWIFPAGLILLGYVMLRCAARNTGLFTIFAGITAAVLLFSSHWVLQSWAVPEILEALIMAGWSMTLGLRLLLNSSLGEDRSLLRSQSP